MPLHPQAVSTLQDYVATLSDRRPGTRLSRTAGWRAIKKAFRIARIEGAPTEIGSHTLRKTFARLIYSALGHDLVRTSYALRHASVSTTVEYLSFCEEEVDAAIRGI